MPPRHGACKGSAVLRARAAPGLRHARSTVSSAASAVAGLRRRRAAFALAGGRGKPRTARLNITACCMPAALAAELLRHRRRAARRIRAGSRCMQQTVMSCAPAACRTQRALMKRRAPCVLKGKQARPRKRRREEKPTGSSAWLRPAARSSASAPRSEAERTSLRCSCLVGDAWHDRADWLLARSVVHAARGRRTGAQDITDLACSASRRGCAAQRVGRRRAAKLRAPAGTQGRLC